MVGRAVRDRWLTRAWMLLATGCGGAVHQDRSASEGDEPSIGTTGGGDAGKEPGGGSGGQPASSGGLSGGGGIAGSSAMPSRCNPPEPSLCDSEFQGFIYDPVYRTCETSKGWCNDGYILSSLVECVAECSGSPDVYACEAASECMIVPLYCCAGCDPARSTDLQAVNVAYSSFTRGPCSSDQTCSDCPPIEELSTTRQYFVPVCEFGQCDVLDIRLHDVTSCQNDSDCRLRDGSACCVGCDGQGLVAVSSEEVFAAQCTSEDRCPDCALATDYRARCYDSRCVVGYGPPPL